ncbi:MAG: hypothetical protein SPLM_10480 [Spiroplasma phoeniceum]
MQLLLLIIRGNIIKHSFNQKTGKYYSKLIHNVNIYLNENKEKVWNKFNDFTYSQRIEYLINFFIKHNKIDKE